MDYFKEYAYRNHDQKSTEIYFNFINSYGDLEYDLSKINKEETKKIIDKILTIKKITNIEKVFK